MFSNQQHPARKIATLGLITVLTIGTAAGLNIDYPSNDDVFSSDFDFNVSSVGEDYDLWHQAPDDSWELLEGNISSTSRNVDTAAWDSTGTHTLKANDTADSSDSVDIGFDISGPTESDDAFTPSDNGYATSTSPDVEVRIDKNGPASLSNIWLEVTGNDNTYTEKCTDFDDSNPRSCSFSPDLSEGESYDVNWNATDAVGNTNDGSWSFTVDTEYNGGDSPELEWEPDVTDSIVVMEDEEADLTVTLESTDSDEDVDENAETLRCYDGDTDDTEVDSGDFSQNDDDLLEATCSFDTDEDYLDDNEVDLTVEMCDAAGNCDTSDEATYTFDVSDPNLLTASMPGSVVNGEYPVDFTASDDASGLDSLEYFYDDDTVEQGSGTSVDIDSSTEEFTASVDTISSGEHTLYFRVQDGAGRWSDIASVEIDYRPDAEPDITMTATESITVTAGQTTDFEVTVENTGNIFIGSSELTASVEGVFSQTEVVEGLEPGSSTTVGFSIDTTTDNVGSHTLELSATNPETSKQLELIVEATSSQENDLDSKLSTYADRLSQLESDLEAKRGDFGSQLASRVETNLTDFRQNIEEAQTAQENGNYYRVSSLLENIDSEYQAAQQSFEQAKEIDNRRDTRMWMMVGGALLLVLVAAGGGFYYYRSDGEIDVDLESVTSGDLELPAAGGLVEKVKSLFGSAEDEAEEFEWDGFKN